MDDRDNGDLSPARSDRWTHLAAGILSQGAKMAVKERNVEAIYWLLSPQAELLSSCVEISYGHIRRWALSQVEMIEKSREKFSQQNALFYIGPEVE